MFLHLAVGLRQGKRRDIILEASFFFAERNGGSAAGRELRDQSLPQEALCCFPSQQFFFQRGGCGQGCRVASEQVYLHIVLIEGF